MLKWLFPLLLLLSTLDASQLECDMGAENALLMNARTGAILYEKNAHKSVYPASTTKIATALYALNKSGLDRKMTATRECIASITPQAKKQSDYRSPPHWLESDGTHIGIKAGEEFRFYDLLAAIMIASANDASNVIAHNVSGSIPKFMEEVGHYLKEIGCHNTSYNNPHGLHHPDHTTTPYDLAIMAREGLRNPTFAELVKLPRYEAPQTNLEYERTFLQTNSLLRSGPGFYPRAIGVKTGTTQAAGKNLVAAAESEGRCLIAVAMGHRGPRADLFKDVRRLFETAFNEQKLRRYLLRPGLTEVTTKVAGARRRLKTTLPEGLYYDFYPSEETAVKAKVNWELPELPIEAGACVGSVRVVDGTGFVLQEMELLAFESLKPTLWYRTSSALAENNRGRKILFFIGSGLLILFLLRLRKKRSRRPLF